MYYSTVVSQRFLYSGYKTYRDDRALVVVEVRRPVVHDFGTGASDGDESWRLNWLEPACHVRRSEVRNRSYALCRSLLAESPFNAFLVPSNVIARVKTWVTKQR
jgi:hypothetical protein